MKIGILTSGGDAPGMNAALRAVTCAALKKGIEVFAIYDGYKGMVEGNIKKLTKEDVDEILNKGGTIIRSARLPEFKELEVRKKAVEQLKKHGIDAIVVIGGDGSYMGAKKLDEMGIRCVGLPGTIDNDISSTDITIGFDTSLNTIVEEIEKIKDTGKSHSRCMLVEVMGHRAGWIALHAGMAGGADVILLPELGFDPDKVNEAILRRAQKGKLYSIVVVAEGVKMADKKKATDFLTHEIEEKTGLETRKTVLGYIQRGGNPSPFDRILATRLGGYAAELIANGKFGCMVCVKDSRIDSIPLKEVAGKLKLVTPENDLVVQGKRMGISFGI